MNKVHVTLHLRNEMIINKECKCKTARRTGSKERSKKRKAKREWKKKDTFVIEIKKEQKGVTEGRDRKEVYEEFHKNRWNMHSTAERGEASRRRRASPGKPESRRGKKEEWGNQRRWKDATVGRERRRSERMNAGWVGISRGSGVGQIKERKVRERTFGTSSRTKSNFSPTTKLSYFPRNMHARGRAQVLQQRFPASYLWHSAISYGGIF